MKIVAVTCVKNEIDIIEAFVRHTLACVDQLIVLDHASSDGTLAVLQALQAENLPLEILEDSSPGKYQARRQTRLMHQAATVHQADWVLPLDADEFLAVRQGRLIPPGTDASRPVLIPWDNYTPHESDDAGELNPVLRLRHRLAHAGAWHSKVIVPHAIASHADAELKQGNHNVVIGKVECDALPSDEIQLAHFPIRSRGQCLAKLAINYLQYQMMPDRGWDWGWRYRELFPQLLRDPRSFAANYCDVVAKYQVPPQSMHEATLVLDPLNYKGGPLRHTPDMDDESRALQAVLAFSTDLTNRFAALNAGRDHQRSGLLTGVVPPAPAAVRAHALRRVLLVHARPLDELGGAELSLGYHVQHAPPGVKVDVIQPHQEVDLPRYDAVVLANLRGSGGAGEDQECATAELWLRRLGRFRGFVLRHEADVHPCGQRDACCVACPTFQRLSCSCTPRVPALYERLYERCSAVRFLSPAHEKVIRAIIRVHNETAVIAPPVDLDLFRNRTPFAQRQRAALIVGDDLRVANTAPGRALAHGYEPVRMPYLSVPHADMPELLNTFQAVVVDPVMFHAFGRIVVEAMASGCHVLTGPRVGAMSWSDPIGAVREANKKFWRLLLQGMNADSQGESRPHVLAKCKKPQPIK